MKSNNYLVTGFAAVLVLVLFPVISFAAVTVSAECAWDDTELKCYIYADTGGTAILSGGVELSYGTSELTNPVAVKNEDVWFFGEPGATHDYDDPDTSTPGKIIFIVGKLKESAPTEGVNDDKALIGTATFQRSSATKPCSDPTSPANFFGLGLTLGRAVPYANFVATDGTEMDAGVTFEILAYPRGDAEKDCDVDVFDILENQNIITASGFSHWADCEGDGDVDVFDILCQQVVIQNQ